MDKRTSWEWLFQPIENEKDVSLILNSISMVFYVMAILYSFMGIIYYFSTKPSLAFLFDVVLCLSGGYFLPIRKSRALSILYLLYAGLITVLTFMSIVGLYKEGIGGKNIILGITLIVASYRSLFATYVYHRLIKSKIAWENIFYVILILSTISVIYFFVFVFILTIYGINFESQSIFMPLYTIIIVAILAILTKRLPFTKNSKSIND